MFLISISVYFYHALIMFGFFEKAFWINLTSSLLSGLLVIIVVGIFTFLYTDIFKKPNLRMVAKQDGVYNDVIKFIKEEGGDYRARFQLAIKNSGNLTFKANEGFWHTYINTNSSTPLSAPGEKNHQRGLISHPIYSDYITDIDNASYDLVIKKGVKPTEGIRYFFATDHGYFPKTVKFNLTNGTVSFQTIGILEFQIPD